MMKYGFALALLAAPVCAFAQAAPAEGPVTVEIVSAGQVTVQANRFRFSVTLSGQGADEKAAEAALAANRARLVQALAVQNVREGQPLEGPANSFASLFATFAGRGKTSFSTDLLDDNEKPQSTASETLFFDAPSRLAASNAKGVVEANGGKMADEVIGILDDYATPTRQAKADAIAKARKIGRAHV